MVYYSENAENYTQDTSCRGNQMVEFIKGVQRDIPLLGVLPSLKLPPHLEGRGIGGEVNITGGAQIMSIHP